MTATLVETFAFPAPHQISRKDTIPSGGNVASPVLGPPAHLPSVMSIEERWAIQLVHLASQYHGSEYHQAKFGRQGCPMSYIPLSVTAPNHVAETRRQQAEWLSRQAWWLCDDDQSADTASGSIRSASPPVVLGPCSALDVADVDIEEELLEAISAPLPSPEPPVRQMVNHPMMKTSQSHPINISILIPPERLHNISSQLACPSGPSPTLYDIPATHTLEKIIERSAFLTFITPPSPPISFATYSRPPVPSPERLARPTLGHFCAASTITEAIQTAINTGIASTLTSTFPAQRLNFKRSSSEPWEGAAADPLPVTTKEDEKPALRSMSVPPPPEVPSISKFSRRPRSFLERSKTPSYRALGNVFAPAYHSLMIPHSAHPKIIIEQDAHTFPADSDTSVSMPPFLLGNLFLSSCPGKKVRLQGPVKGRGAVCRDLRTDLQRMKNMGTQCVVCCLDDPELEFLGAPWSEYRRCAQEVGLDVLRLPLPEGFAPLTPAYMDEHLSQLIKKYTLAGQSVLVHCRGGVGRAGLFACCWMLKLGLCGWLETDPSPSPAIVRRDTLQLVERAINTVRRRRSVKAVETYEQVKFLVDYVEYLRVSAASNGQ